MMESWLNSSTVAILFVVVFVVDAFADLLNLQTSKNPLPPDLTAVQEPAEQTRATRYLADRLKVGFAQGLTQLVLFLLLLQQGLFGWLQRWVEGLSDQPLLQALIYAGLFAAGRGLVSTGFAAYSTFRVEARYGFNRTTPGTFVGDRLKGALIGIILGGLLFSFLVSVFNRFGQNAFWIIWLGYTLFQFFLVWIAPVALLPLFLKLSPLPEGELKTSIESYRDKLAFKLDGVWVCDASKRSAKSNAFFTGFGKFRRLVLFDTLIQQHTTQEITAIVAHEAGHFKLGHIWKMSLVSAVTSLILFYAIQSLIHNEYLYSAFGLSPGNLGLGLIFAMALLDQIKFFFSPLGSYFSRRNEYAADRFSVQTTGDAASLRDGLKRLVRHNLATLQHHPLYVILNDSHPPLPDRLAALHRK